MIRFYYWTIDKRLVSGTVPFEPAIVRGNELLVCDSQDECFWVRRDRLLDVGWMTDAERDDYLLCRDRFQELLRSWKRSRLLARLTRRGHFLGLTDLVEVVRRKLGI